MGTPVIEVTLANGEKRTYKNVDEWRADVARERHAGVPRWSVPAVDLKTVVPFYKNIEDVFPRGLQHRSGRPCVRMRHYDPLMTPAKAKTKRVEKQAVEDVSTASTLNRKIREQEEE